MPNIGTKLPLSLDIDNPPPYLVITFFVSTKIPKKICGSGLWMADYAGTTERKIISAVLKTIRTTVPPLRIISFAASMKVLMDTYMWD